MTEKNFKNLLVETDQGVTSIILNRPNLHNVFNSEMIAELSRLFISLSSEPGTQVVVLTGAGDSFCAGADLHWMKTAAEYSFEENQADAEKLHQLLMSVYTCAKPVIARVNGPALGGGVGLVAAVDMAFAEANAVFGFSEVRLGLIPAVISPFVLRKIGEKNAREYFLTGERFLAERAKEIGLIQEMGTPDEIENLISQKIKALKSGGPTALAECKKLIREINGKALDQVGKETAKRIAQRRASAEGKEGINAFLEKRKPKWVKGKGCT